MLISVILISYNTAKMSIEVLSSLFSSVGNFELEVFVVDNASNDNSAKIIKQAFPNVALLENKTNVGFGRANNQVLDLVKGDYVLLLNTDAFVQIDTLQKSAEYMYSHPNCGVLGVKLLGRHGELQPSCRYFPTPFNLLATRIGLNRLLPNIKLVDDANWNSDISQACDWVPGCYYLVRKEVIQQVGLFDPLYFLYCEEVDHCFATKKAGWDVTYFSETSVVHIGGESAKSDNVIENKSRQINALRIESELLYFRKNHGLLGVLSHILFTHAADFYDFAKSCLRLQFGSAFASFRNSALFWQIFVKTYFARQSTR